jgi:hypothetical protein
MQNRHQGPESATLVNVNSQSVGFLIQDAGSNGGHILMIRASAVVSAMECEMTFPEASMHFAAALEKTMLSNERTARISRLLISCWRQDSQLDYTWHGFVDETGTNTAVTRAHGLFRKARISPPKLSWFLDDLTFVADIAHHGSRLRGCRRAG